MNNTDKLKDKKIQTLEVQLKLIQDRKIESDKQVLMMNDIIVGYQKRIAFYRSGIEKGLDIKDMFLEEIPFYLQVDYEIANYKHLVDQIRRFSTVIAWIASKTINKIIENLEETKKEDIALRKKAEGNKNKNLKIVE